MAQPSAQSGEGPDAAADAAPDAAADVDALVERLRETVEERRREGRYPAGLEEDLDAHFRRLAVHRTEPDLSALEAVLAGLAGLPGLSLDRIPASSEVPGGAALHRALARVTARQIQGVLEQVGEQLSALHGAVRELAAALRLPDTHIHPDLVGQVDVVQERLSALERQPVGSPAGLAELGRRLEALEAAEARRRFHPPFRWADFEAEFRGTGDEIRQRYADLVPHLIGAGPVLDIGCGRGEILELLRQAGVEARGVELDAELAADAVARGLDVEVGDGLHVLAAAPDGSLGGLVLIQVVEHLTPGQVAELVELAVDKVRPGGRVVIETPNPQSLYVFARAFYLDPTHVAPVHPAYLRFLFEQAGFSGVELLWRSPPPEEEVLAPVGETHIDENMERVNRVLFAPQDYALVATR